MIIAIKRAKRFSPNSEDKDARILQTTCDLLKDSGFDVRVVSEEGFKLQEGVDAYISMARSEEALNELQKAGDVPVFNSPEAVLRCQNRREMLNFLHKEGFNIPFPDGDKGYWIKKNIGYTECEEDIVFAADETQRDAAIDAMKARGIDDVYVEAHVEGDLVKFYGVADTPFFRYYYPDDDGDMKFSNKGLNGKPQHFEFDELELQEIANEAANSLGLDFYGGDCIVKSDGDMVFIDFNDWPSYSRCCNEAAEYMAITVVKTLVNKDKKLMTEKLLNNEFEGIIFDYGGTLDSGGMHWGKRIWHAYQEVGVPVDEALFREAYVHAERTLAKNPIIKPDFNFTDTLEAKLKIELEYIQQHTEGFNPDSWLEPILEMLIMQTEDETLKSLFILSAFFKQCCKKMVLVSNFYGNINSVLKQFHLNEFFTDVIESSVVGVRKPDPEIFRLGMKALGISDPSKVLVIGDSYDKDILPAHEIGCKTLWFMGEGWNAKVPDGKAADWAVTDWDELRMVNQYENKKYYYKH